MSQKALRRIAIANLKAGILDSNLKINHNIKELTKDPAQQRQLHHIAYHMRSNYEPSNSNSVYMLSNQKINNDTKRASKKMENLVQPVKSHKTDFGMVSTFDFKSISHLGDIGEIQQAMYNRIANTQLLKKVDQLSPDYIKQISMVTKSNANETYGSHRYENLLRRVDPKVAQHYKNQMLKQQHKIQKENAIADHQAEIKNKRRMHHEFRKLHQLEHGNLDKPIMDAKDIRNKAIQVRKNIDNKTKNIKKNMIKLTKMSKGYNLSDIKNGLTNAKDVRNRASYVKAKMTRLINATKKNPYMHRFPNKWDEKNDPRLVSHQRKINLIHNYIAQHPQDVVTQKLNEDTKNGINGAYGAVEDTTRFIGNGFDFPHNKNIPSWIKAVKNIDNADFYNKQLPYIKHAYRMSRKYDELPKQAYLHQYHSYSSKYDNMHATSNNWLKFQKLTDQAKPKQPKQFSPNQSFSSKVHSLRKKHKASSVSAHKPTNHYSKQQIMQYRRSRGIQR